MGRAGLEKGFAAHHNYSFRHSGVLRDRKAVDQIGRSPACLTRVWAFVVALACFFLLASVTPAGNSIQAKPFYPSNLVLSFPREYRPSAQLLWELRAEEMLALSFDSKPHPRSFTSHGGGTLTYPGKHVFGDSATASELPFIEDIVVLPDDLDLFIVRHGSSVDQKGISACRYGEKPELSSVPRVVDLLPDGRLGVSCTRPSSLRMQHPLKVANVSLDNGVGAAPIVPHLDGTLQPARWDEALVYAVQPTDGDVVLYVKNNFHSSRRKATEYTDLENFWCRFGEAVETRVTAGALEVFRCDFPNVDHPTKSATRVKVHLIYKGKTIPSVAYYEPIEPPLRDLAEENENSDASSSQFSSAVEDSTAGQKKHLVCSCTMIWNVAEFLKEWVMYNSDLGVEKFFLYDNNSEDDIRNTVTDLSQYRVTRIPWPWVKTQEAGFSHCAVEAQRECTWILFTDVDEFLFPKKWLPLTDEPESGRESTAPPRTPTTSPTSTTSTTARPESPGPSETLTTSTSPSTPIIIDDSPESPGPLETVPSSRGPVLESPLAALIADTLEQAAAQSSGRSSSGAAMALARAPSAAPAAPSLPVGQLSFRCVNFGPSGLRASPPQGVTQGYTCRERAEQRHKSMVRFAALRPSLQNVIHHFALRPSHRTLWPALRHAPVHHYKFQAWPQFRHKFARRASTAVADWRDPRNLASRDRPAGLGPDATRPPAWEASHCAVNDTSLRDYTRRRFAVAALAGAHVTLAWQL